MYSPTTHMNGGMTTTWYIDNSYVWFALKLGLVGALVFVALLLLQVKRAWSILRVTVDIRRRRLVLGALATRASRSSSCPWLGHTSTGIPLRRTSRP